MCTKFKYFRCLNNQEILAWFCLNREHVVIYKSLDLMLRNCSFHNNNNNNNNIFLLFFFYKKKD